MRLRQAAIILSTLLIYSTLQAAPLHVMLDPGHGGIDSGASRGQIIEKHITLKLAQKLAEQLRADPRFKVTLTRTTDRKVSLKRRVEAAKNVNADLFLSIHLNSSTDRRARGTEIYFQNQLPADEEAMFLVSREHEDGEEESADDENPATHMNTAHTTQKAEPISVKTDLKRILEDLHRNERILASSDLGRTLFETWLSTASKRIYNPTNRTGGRAVRQAPFHVVSYIDIPSVLVEVGYVSHPEEGKLLERADYQSQVASSLFEGLVKFKESLDNSKTETLKSQASTL